MKLAGSLSLILAIILGIWAGHDYSNHEKDKDLAQFELKLDMQAKQFGATVPMSDATSKLKDIAEAERFDGIVAVAAFCVLIASVAFSPKTVNHNRFSCWLLKEIRPRWLAVRVGQWGRRAA